MFHCRACPLPLDPGLLRLPTGLLPLPELRGKECAQPVRPGLRDAAQQGLQLPLQSGASGACAVLLRRHILLHCLYDSGRSLLPHAHILGSPPGCWTSSTPRTLSSRRTRPPPQEGGPSLRTNRLLQPGMGQRIRRSHLAITTRSFRNLQFAFWESCGQRNSRSGQQRTDPAND